MSRYIYVEIHEDGKIVAQESFEYNHLDGDEQYHVEDHVCTFLHNNLLKEVS